MKNDARLDLRLPTELKQRVDAAAEGSVNAWVRDAIERKLRVQAEITSEQPGLNVLKEHTKRQQDDRKAQPPKATKDLTEIPLPKIAPRRWGS